MLVGEGRGVVLPWRERVRGVGVALCLWVVNMGSLYREALVWGLGC